MSEHATEHGTKIVTIVVDCVEYKVPVGPVSAIKIRALTNPPIGDDRDLYLERPGEDRKLEPGDVVEIEDGMVFYTAPCSINPGSAAA